MNLPLNVYVTVEGLFLMDGRGRILRGGAESLTEAGRLVEISQGKPV